MSVPTTADHPARPARETSPACAGDTTDSKRSPPGPTRAPPTATPPGPAPTDTATSSPPPPRSSAVAPPGPTSRPRTPLPVPGAPARPEPLEQVPADPGQPELRGAQVSTRTAPDPRRPTLGIPPSPAREGDQL